MHYSDIIRYASGLLQFGVAFYALRLGRLFSTARVGWLLFSALSILALANLLLPLNPFRGSLQMGVKVDIIYGLCSVLLLAAMAHFDLRFRKRLDSEESQRETQSQWETQVQQRFEAANKGNEELQQIAAQLQADLAAHKQAQEQAEKSHQEQLAASRLTEEELRQTITRLEAQIAEQQETNVQAREQAERTHQEQLAAAQQAGTTAALNEFGGRMFSRMASLPGDLNAALRGTDDLVKSRLGPIAQIAKLLGEHARDTARPANGHRRPRQLSNPLTNLSHQLSREQRVVLKKLHSLEQQLAAVKVTVQQSYDEAAAAAGVEPMATAAEETVSLLVGEPAPSSAHLEETAGLPAETPAPQTPVAAPPSMESPATVQEHILSNVTETGTELPESQPVTAPPAPAQATPNPVVEPPRVAQLPQTNWPLPRLKMMTPTPQPDLGGKSA